MNQRVAWYSVAIIVALFLGIDCRPINLHAEENADVDAVVGLLELVIDADVDAARKCLGVLVEKIQNRELDEKSLEPLRLRLSQTLAATLKGGADQPLYADAVRVSATLRDPMGLLAARKLVRSATGTSAQRIQSLEALIFANDAELFALVPPLLVAGKESPVEFRAALLAALNRWDEPRVAVFVLAAYDQFEPDLQPKAVELLTQRPAWAKLLLQAMADKKLPSSILNANQVSRLQSSRDDELKKLVTSTWGSVRLERNPQREQVIRDVREALTKKPGDATRGHAVFKKVCGQCHKIYGEGQEVGPDITANGRASFDQLLSNVLDPSLVIGASYQARIVVTTDGRVLTGLLAEDNEQRIVLKMQGGKQEAIARDDIEELRVSQLSLMPEGLETQLMPQELLDLFAFLIFDKPPGDVTARLIPGAVKP